MNLHTEFPGVYRVRTGTAAPTIRDRDGMLRRMPLGQTKGYVLECLRLGAFTYSWSWVWDWDFEPTKEQVAVAIEEHQKKSAKRAEYEAFEPYFVTPETAT